MRCGINARHPAHAEELVDAPFVLKEHLHPSAGSLRQFVFHHGRAVRSERYHARAKIARPMSYAFARVLCRRRDSYGPIFSSTTRARAEPRSVTSVMSTMRKAPLRGVRGHYQEPRSGWSAPTTAQAVGALRVSEKVDVAAISAHVACGNKVITPFGPATWSFTDAPKRPSPKATFTRMERNRRAGTSLVHRRKWSRYRHNRLPP